MKNRITQITILGLLATAVVTAESCRKEDPPAETIDNDSTTTGSGSSSGSGSGGTTVNGCTDIDSPFYSSSATSDDGSCQYAYTSGYEISYFPEEDDGDSWDAVAFGNYKKADLVLRIKEQGATDWEFESSVEADREHNSPTTWTTTGFKLLNKTYTWELVDDDTVGENEISSGTFNPITAASNGTISVTGTHPDSGELSLLKITYTLQ